MKRVLAAIIGTTLVLAALTTSRAENYSYTLLSPGYIPLGGNNANTVVGYSIAQDGSKKLSGFIMNYPDYTNFDYFGLQTVAADINEAGTIAGFYQGLDRRYHGYTLTGVGGAWSTFNCFGAVNTYAMGINNKGDVVGFFDALDGKRHGFVRRMGVCTPINCRSATGGTYASGINDAGTIVGWCAGQQHHGFVLNGGGLMTFDVLGSSMTEARGINNAGTIVGTQEIPGVGLAGFTMNHGNVASVGMTYGYGINDHGSLAGAWGELVNVGVVAEYGISDAPDGIDWAMPDHLVAGKDYDNITNGDGLLRHSSIYPPDGWTVNLFLTRNKQQVGVCSDPLVEWRWEVTPASDVVTAPAPGCTTTMAVRELGTYSVTAKKFTRPTTLADFSFEGTQISQAVLARDFLIVGMGDSNASGEGNPPWINLRCDRSQSSYQFMSALFAEQQDPHSSVTFLFPACSGARIEHINQVPYKGINPDSNLRLLEPQLKQVTDLLKLTGTPGEPKNPRSVDAVILSIGINNLYFGSLMKFCVKQGLPSGIEACQEVWARLDPVIGSDAGVNDRAYVEDPLGVKTIADRMAYLQANLDYPGYAALQVDLTRAEDNGGLGVASNHIIITQYPDFTHDWTGGTCNTKTGTFANVPKWGTSTWTWLREQAGILNATVAQTAKYGWQVAVLNQDQFSTHGYCAGDYLVTPYPWPPFYDTVPMFGQSYFLGAGWGMLNDNPAGGFHPVKAGHGITANAVKPLLCNALFGNITCEGPPTR